MEQKNWITTEQMLDALKKDADNEQEYTLSLGGSFHSTHWLIFDSQREQFGNSTDGRYYDWFTEAGFLEYYAGRWWRRDV